MPVRHPPSCMHHGQQRHWAQVDACTVQVAIWLLAIGLSKSVQSLTQVAATDAAWADTGGCRARLTAGLQCAGSEVTESVLAPFHPGNKPQSRKRLSAPAARDQGNMGDSTDAPPAEDGPDVFFDQSQQSNKAGKVRRRKASYVQDPIYQKKQKLTTRSTRSRLSTMA
jgi:hypothetical protein